MLQRLSLGLLASAISLASLPAIAQEKVDDVEISKSTASDEWSFPEKSFFAGIGMGLSIVTYDTQYVYNLGLSSANISKIMLAKKIQKQYNQLSIKIVTNRKDPDKRDYFVSNKKIEKKGFKAKISLEDGISELIQIFTNDKNKVINNY